uniref:Lipase-like C-terminal domain-containing protein n=1 Tax=Hyaloperonospora arabidopsidis (strain Emoy2) TaxID=559515 RepID=M4BJ57_HYAAE
MSVRFFGTTLVLFITALSLYKTQATNSYPIVLVSGFSGWGRDELSGFRYWGGSQGDFQNDLTARGYTVFTAAVGPLSSNWDRACELYALIKGGQVDYGQNHSATHNHLRYGRNYTGLYTKWGTINSNGSINKVHLVGHSMGGQTARMLTQMLEHGTSGAPIEEDPSSHPLFSGGKSWVHSITTISTPNQGTTLADGIAEIAESVIDLIAFAYSVFGSLGSSAELFYDVKLDHWGISSKQPGETLRMYFHRIFSSRIFDPGFRDVCLWSLSTSGAKEEATWVKTLGDVYYYSYTNVATFDTRDWFFRKISLPHRMSVMLILKPFAVFLGGRYAPDKLKLPTEWQPNDGLVNSISMASDGIGGVVAFTGSSQLGKWNVLPQIDRLDHLGILGNTIHTQVLDLYEGHAALLASLPTTSNSRRLRDDSTLAVAKLDKAIQELSAAMASVETKGDLEALCKSPKNAYAQSYCETLLESVTTRHLRGYKAIDSE